MTLYVIAIILVCKLVVCQVEHNDGHSLWTFNLFDVEWVESANQPKGMHCKMFGWRDDWNGTT